MKRILYVYNTNPTFVQLDEAILREVYEVRALYVRHRSAGLLAQMWRETRDVDGVVAWFASWHSLPAFLAAKLRGIPTLLITGGYDVANAPEIDYGLRRGGLPKVLSGAAFRLADQALAFSESAYQEALRNTPLTPAKTRVLPLGVPDHPAFAQATPREAIALTVSFLDATAIRRKGVDRFVAAAALLPDVRFVVVGKLNDSAAEQLREAAAPNVHFTGFASDDELADWRTRAAVYVQASAHEGFGLALAESMLARSVPIVSGAGSLREVVDSAGIYLEDRTPQAIATAIDSALHLPMLGEAARDRILREFPLAKRRKGLLQAVESLTRD